MAETKTPLKRTALPMKAFPCTCEHEYQDKRYGKGIRIHNPCAKGYRCTVCMNVRITED